MTPSRRVSILGLALALSLGSAAFAEEPSASPGPIELVTIAPLGPLGLVKSSMTRVLGIIQSSPVGSNERRIGIVRVSHDLFDFDEIARLALGQHWHGLSPGDQDEFVQLFTDVLERAFIASVDGYTNENVAFFGEAIDGAWAQVRSRITPSKGDAVSIDYRLHEGNLRWTVYDVVWGRDSLVASYRSQFNSVIRASSFASLIERMRSDRLRRRDSSIQTPFAHDRLAAGLLPAVLARHAPTPR